MNARIALKHLEDIGVKVELVDVGVKLLGAEVLSEDDISRLRKIKPDIIAELKRASQQRPPIGAFFYDQDRADERNAEAALEGSTARYCACGLFGMNGVGRRKLSEHNPEGVERWLCDDCFKCEFGTH